MIKDKNSPDFPFYYIRNEELKEKIKISKSLGITLPAYALDSLRENKLESIDE